MAPRWTAIAAVLAFAACATGQMTIPTSGVLPTGFIDHSFLLGDDLADFQSMWASPTGVVQQGWKNSIQSAAGIAFSGSAPTSFSQAASQAAMAQSSGLRYAMTGSASDLSKVVATLLVADIPPGTFITRPEVLTSYLSAYDFIRGASTSELSPATRAAIESRLLGLANSLDNGNQTLSNARGKIGATRALAGVLLQDQALLDTGLGDLNGHFAYSTTDDGWFADSQGHYLNYTLRHVSLFARAYEQGSGVDLYPNLAPYVDMTIGLRLPSGAVPNVSNGTVSRVGVHLLSPSSDPETAGLAMWNLTAGLPTNYNGYQSTNLVNNDNTATSFFALINFLDAAATAPSESPTFLTRGQSHVSVFRQDWSTTSDYLLLSAGIDSPATVIEGGGIKLVLPAFHMHNDTSEILLAARGQYILVAPGYERTDLPNSPPNFTPQKADWHNVILVDGNVGMTDALNAGPELGRTMRPEDFVHTHRLDSTEHGSFKGVSDFSTLATSYNGASVERSVAFPGEDYFVVADHIQSDGSHTYGFNLIGRGVRSVLSQTPGRIDVQWEFNGARVIEHLFSTSSMTLTTDTRWMHYEFNQFEQTYRMLAEITADDALFLSVMETGDAGALSPLTITNLTSGPDVLGILVENTAAGWTDTILTQLGNALTTAGRLSSDARYGYLREVDGDFTGAMIAEGTTFLVDGDVVFDLSSAATLSLWFEENLVLGTVSDDGLTAGTSLRLFNRGYATGAWIDGQAIDYSNHGSWAEFTIENGGELRIEFSTVPEPTTTAFYVLAVASMALARLAGRRASIARASLIWRRLA